VGAGYGAEARGGRWALVGTHLQQGGCPGRAGALCSLQGWGAGLLPTTHGYKEMCLKEGGETKDLQDSTGRCWVSSLPSLLGGKI